MERFESFIGVNPWTALFVLLNTLTIYYVARKYLFGPVMKIIEDRQREINGMYKAAGDAKDEANALKAAYQEKISAARSTSERLVQEATVRARDREEALLRQARAEASAILDKAAAEIAREKKKALNDAKNEISGLAMAIAGKVVGRNLKERDPVEHFLRELGDQI